MLRSAHVARATSVFAALLAVAAPASAAPLITGLGGPVGYGTEFLPENDDSSSDAIDVTGSFPGGLRFFGDVAHRTIHVNTNGNITFSGGLSDYTPDPFPVADRPMIAPYWADVDIRGPGFPSANGVYWALRPGQLVVTWHNVGYFNQHDDKKMDFQLIVTNSLECGAGDFEVEFRYNRCEWTTGDASDGEDGFGGTPGQAGFDAGNNRDYVEIPGSRTMQILQLCTTSNVGEPGIWRFSVRNGEVSCPGTGLPCQSTDRPGVCGAGLTQCRAGGIDCVPLDNAPSAERCDGLDNDCNGVVDDNAPCAMAGSICAYGVCQAPCFEGGCFEGQVCNDTSGLCVDTSCMGVTCPPGQRCQGGQCVDLCSNVTCPHGLACISGRCVDVCSVITCGEEDICVEGACVRRCPCGRCDADEVCSADGECIPLGCDIVTCNRGFYCRGGQCLNACDGARCPPGEYCTLGRCVPGTAPPPSGDGGNPIACIGAECDAGGDRGCGCRVTSVPSWPSWAWIPLAAGAFAFLRRRRR